MGIWEDILIGARLTSESAAAAQQGRGTSCRRAQVTSGSEQNALYLDCGGGLTAVYPCPKALICTVSTDAVCST